MLLPTPQGLYSPSNSVQQLIALELQFGGQIEAQWGAFRRDQVARMSAERAGAEFLDLVDVAVRLLRS